MTRTWRILWAAVVIVLLGASPAAAGANGHGRDRAALVGDFWTYVLRTPTPTNPFTLGTACVPLSGDVVLPFAVFGQNVNCTVSSRTRVLVTAVTYECSTAEAPTIGGTPAELEACAQGWLDAYPEHTVTVDGRRVGLRPLRTGVISVRLPQDNVLGSTDRTVRFAASAWAVVLPPLRPGRHTIVSHADGPTVDAADSTTIIDVRGCR